MAQAPAAPKLKRAAVLAATALVGPRRARRGAALMRSERAALDLRAARQGHIPGKAQTVTFLVPLVGPSDQIDWDAVQARLAGTLASFQSQTNPNWTALICCQTRPDLPEDARIRYIPFDDPAPGNDKWRKLAVLCDALGELRPAPGYVMSFDADDLLHPGAVDEMLRRQAPGGYLVSLGYVQNHGTGAIALARPRSLSQPMRKPFWKLCGSCMALRHDPGLPASADFLRAMMQHEHRMFPYLARLAGVTPAPFSRAMVLYVLNHGDNFGARRGRVSFKARFVERFCITDAQELAQIAQDFALEPVNRPAP